MSAIENRKTIYNISVNYYAYICLIKYLLKMLKTVKKTNIECIILKHFVKLHKTTYFELNIEKYKCKSVLI